MSMRITQKDLIWGYIGPLFNLGANIIILPFTLSFLSESLLGLWYVFTSIGNLIVLFDFGFSPTIARNIAYCYSGAQDLKERGIDVVKSGNANYHLLKEIIWTCKCVYFIISIIALLLMQSIGTLYIRKITRGLNEQYLLAWIIYCFGAFLNLFYGYLTAYLKGIGALEEHHKSIIISKMLQIGTTILFFQLGFGLIAVSTGYFICGLSYRLSALHYLNKYENIQTQIAQCKETVDWRRIKRLFLTVWCNAWKEGIISLSNYLTSYAITLICAAFLTLSETGIYSLTVQVVNVISNMASAFYSTFQPKLQELALCGNQKESLRIMATAMILFDLLYFLGTIALFVIGVPLLHIIRPNTVFNLYIMLFVCVYTFLNQTQHLYASYISNTNELPYIKAYIVNGLLDTTLSIIVLQKFGAGLWGMLIVQMFCLIIYNAWKWPSVVWKQLNTSGIDFMKCGWNNLCYQIGVRIK